MVCALLMYGVRYIGYRCPSCCCCCCHSCCGQLPQLCLVRLPLRGHGALHVLTPSGTGIIGFTLGFLWFTISLFWFIPGLWASHFGHLVSHFVLFCLAQIVMIDHWKIPLVKHLGISHSRLIILHNKKEWKEKLIIAGSHLCWQEQEKQSHSSLVWSTIFQSSSLWPQNLSR